MRIKAKVNVAVTADTAGKDKLFALDDALAELTLDGFTEVNSGIVALADAEEFDVPFAEIGDCRGIFLKVAGGDCTLALNGGAALSVKRGVSSSDGETMAASAKVLIEAMLTDAHIVADGDVTITYLVWGDPVV